MNVHARRAAIAAAVVAGLGVAYVGCLAGLGVALEGTVKDRAEERLGAAFGADVDIGSLDVSLVRGRAELSDIRIEGKQGYMRIVIDHMTAETAPLGWVIVDRHLDEVTLRGATMEVSAAGAVALARKPRSERAIPIGRMELHDVSLSGMPTAFLPGVARVDVHVDHAVTGALDLATALDWVFAVRELDASMETPLGDVATVYTGTALRLDSELFDEAFDVPFTMPTPDPEMLELDQLELLSKELGAALAPEILRRVGKDAVDSGLDWVRGRLSR